MPAGGSPAGDGAESQSEWRPILVSDWREAEWRHGNGRMTV